jgi:Holliday junction resolvasome RuvABC DNA-binding subunit
MTDRQARNAMFDRLIRVRRVRARLALAALGRTQTRQLAEAALLDRVGALVGNGGTGRGVVAADAASARAAADAMLGKLAEDVGKRLTVTRAEQAQLVETLARAKAAVDAAIARRNDRDNAA